jgi:hypothetical protein
MIPMIELPVDFPHEPPKGYSYVVDEFKRNVVRICIVNHATFSYTNTPPKSVWGFYNTKKRSYYAPINYKRCGKEVDVNNTTPYSAMQLNLNPLERALMAA